MHRHVINFLRRLSVNPGTYNTFTIDFSEDEGDDDLDGGNWLCCHVVVVQL